MYVVFEDSMDLRPETWDEHHMIKVPPITCQDHVHKKITPPDAMANSNAKRIIT
jgi:hypothetical protein